MKPATQSPLMMVAVLLTLIPARPEIIDRIAVTVGNRVVTESEILEQIRLTAFMNGAQPDFSPASRRKAADRMVEQKLIRRELDLTRYPAPAAAEIEAFFNRLVSQHRTRAAFDQALRNYGITEQQLRDYVMWQLTLLHFIEVRFRPAIQVTDEEIRDYYEKQLKGKRSLEEYRDRIENTLIAQRTDQELDRWLARARQRTRIEYKKDVVP